MKRPRLIAINRSVFAEGRAEAVCIVEFGPATVKRPADVTRLEIDYARRFAAVDLLIEALEQARAALPDAWGAVGCDVPEDVIHQINDALAAAGIGEHREAAE